ncbi:MAG: HEAT repeat domain-containing protein, partial [Desulfuromonadales bacterium]|nr:HEAT repeat domain-containing protein [Desulfuromonadales bacterium]
KHDDDALVCSALNSLGRIGVPEAEEPILGALRDPRASVRKAAAEALGELEV